MNMRGHHHVLMEETGGGDGGSGAAGGGGGGEGAGAAAAAAGAAGDAGGAADGSALAAGAGEASGAAGAAGDAAAATPFGAIPEKFRVTKDDGTPDLDASWLKVEEHRAHLERRLGAGDVPPKSADDYKVTVPEAYKDAIKADELAASDRFKDFRTEMHAAGLSQKQFDQVVGKMIDYSVKLQQGQQQLSFNECMTELTTTWPDEAARKAEMASAFRAATAYGDDKVMAKFKNDPDFIRFAAKVGKELGEDRGAAPGAGGTQSTQAEIEALAGSKAYWDAADPQHAIVKAKVTAFYAQKFGDAPKGNGPRLSTL